MLIAYKLAVDLARSLRPAIDAVTRHDKALADQMRRATTSIVLNIAEGERRVGRDQTHLYRIAAGSASEVRAALDVASVWGYVDDEPIAHARELLDRELGLLWGLTRKRR